MRTGVLILTVSLCSGAAAWWVTSTKSDADIAKLTSQYSIALKSISDNAAKGSEAARRREHTFQQQIAAMDALHTKEQENAKREATRLRDDINSGRRRVQFATAALATCEQSAGVLRRSVSMGDETGISLSAIAGRNILDIRAGINEDQAKLAYLQDYIRALQERGVVAK